MAQEQAKNENKRSQAAKSPVKASSIQATSVQDADGGQTIIYNDVVAKIAGMAVREVSGVHELVPFGAGQSVTQLAKRVTGQAMRDLGIQVEVGKVEAAVDVRIITEYGASISEVADLIRANVRDRVEGMTGLKVVEVNIEVVDLFFPSAEKPEEVPSPALPDGSAVPRVR